MSELNDDPRFPTLSDRLRDAAVERARDRGDVIDDIVIDEAGVIDLRIPNVENLGTSATEPAKALASTRGAIASTYDMSDLYAPEPEPRRLWRRRGGDEATASDVTSSPTLAALPASDEIDLRDVPAAEPSPPAVIDRPSPTSRPEVDVTEAEATADAKATADAEATADDTGAKRPTRACPQCGGTGQRDLFDPFSQTDYFSCDDCQTMWKAPHT